MRVFEAVQNHDRASFVVRTEDLRVTPHSASALFAGETLKSQRLHPGAGGRLSSSRLLLDSSRKHGVHKVAYRPLGAERCFSVFWDEATQQADRVQSRGMHTMKALSEAINLEDERG